MIARSKVERYLLSESHPVGGAKARYFRSRGYGVEDPARLEQDLLEVASKGEVTSEERTKWGTKYVVVGEIVAPDGHSLFLTTVWLLRDATGPELVTAYPQTRRTR